MLRTTIDMKAIAFSAGPYIYFFTFLHLCSNGQLWCNSTIQTDSKFLSDFIGVQLHVNDEMKRRCQRMSSNGVACSRYDGTTAAETEGRP